MSTYAKQTFDSPNPMARYAHRSRLKKSLTFALPKLNNGKLLDYGCGSGVFVMELNLIKSGCAYGYEPYMTERKDENLPIHSQFGDVEEFAPFKVVSLFETIEHLSISELDNFLHESEKILEPSGGILISAPIEIGPALILKELNRSIFRLKFSEYRPFELLKAALLGVPGRRAMNIKTSHKGFDFRESIELLSQRGWNVEVLGYGPLPTGTWYGNSQVFLWATKK